MRLWLRCCNARARPPASPGPTSAAVAYCPLKLQYNPHVTPCRGDETAANCGFLANITASLSSGGLLKIRGYSGLHTVILAGSLQFVAVLNCKLWPLAACKWHVFPCPSQLATLYGWAVCGLVMWKAVFCATRVQICLRVAEVMKACM